MPMLGFKNFFSAKQTIAGIESVRMIQKGQIDGFDELKVSGAKNNQLIRILDTLWLRGLIIDLSALSQ